MAPEQLDALAEWAAGRRAAGDSWATMEEQLVGVPEEVVKRFATWQFPKCSENLMRRMLADALSAWPGVKFEHLSGWVMDGPDLPYIEETASIILPLTTQENGDE